LENVQQDTIPKCNHLDSHAVEACAMWARVEGIGTILTNARGGSATTLCIFVVVYFMCKYGCA
jgi:hypothetical protein